MNLSWCWSCVGFFFFLCWYFFITYFLDATVCSFDHEMNLIAARFVVVNDIFKTVNYLRRILESNGGSLGQRHERRSCNVQPKASWIVPMLIRNDKAKISQYYLRSWQERKLLVIIICWMKWNVKREYQVCPYLTYLFQLLDRGEQPTVDHVCPHHSIDGGKYSR